MLDLTPDGQGRVQRRSRASSPSAAPRAAGAGELEAFQHLAIVLDDRIVSLPYINHRENPNGIDGAAGMQISGDLTPQTARYLAAILSAGPLPATLVSPGG